MIPQTEPKAVAPALQPKVESLLRAAFPEADLHLETLPTGAVGGVVVTDRYLRMSDRTRVRVTHAPLRALPVAERHGVLMLLALTHAEYASWLDDQRYW